MSARLSEQAPALLLNADGSIQQLSAAAHRLLGYAERLPGELCFFSLVHDVNLYQVIRDVAKMVCYGTKHVSWMLQLRIDTGQWRCFNVQVSNQLKEETGGLLLHLQEAAPGCRS